MKKHSEKNEEMIEHPNIFQSVTGKSEIVPAMTGLSLELDLYGQLTPTHPLRLSWSHYSIILQEPNAEARAWYENEAANEMWSTRTMGTTSFMPPNISPICPPKRNCAAK